MQSGTSMLRCDLNFGEASEAERGHGDKVIPRAVPCFGGPPSWLPRPIDEGLMGGALGDRVGVTVTRSPSIAREFLSNP